MPMIKNLCAEIYAEKNIRANLIELNQMIKDDAYLDRFLDEYYENEIYFINLLEHSDAKVRKNAVKSEIRRFWIFCLSIIRRRKPSF